MISMETVTVDTHFTHRHLLIGIHTMSRLREPGVKSWHISFHSKFSPLFPTFSWVQTVKLWIDSSGIGWEQQASISEWRRGVFTELPSLHLASPQPRLGRQLQLSAYWVWRHKYWPSAAIVSLCTIMETQTGIHTNRHSLITLSCSLCISFFLLLSLSKRTPCLCVWDWPPRCSVWQRARYWSSLCSHCAKAIQMPVMPAGHARWVRMLV